MYFSKKKEKKKWQTHLSCASVHSYLTHVLLAKPQPCLYSQFKRKEVFASNQPSTTQVRSTTSRHLIRPMTTKAWWVGRAETAFCCECESFFFLKRLSERRRRGPRFKVKRSTNVWVFLATHLGYYLLAAKHAVLFQLSHHKKRLHCQYQSEHHEIVHRQRSSFSCWLHTCIFQH